jgi:Protein of unknown function (DUF1549)/Protein of unknown function (DUF1553)
MHFFTKMTTSFTNMLSVLMWQGMGIALGASNDPATTTVNHIISAGAPSVSVVQPLDALATVDASKTIDRLIDSALSQRGIKIQPRASDEVFLRRVYLGVVGRIPTVKEANDFIASQKIDKREALIKLLIGSEGYISHQYNYWADLLRVTSRLQERYPGQAYIDYIKSSLRVNKPYDKWVTELIQAEGPALALGNGATGYYIRDAGMPLDNMSNTIQVFLGTQLACAQCHNHPSDKWTRMDYYQMAAFSFATAVEKNLYGKQANVPSQEMFEAQKKVKESPSDLRDLFRRYGETVGLAVESKDNYEIHLPADYQYPDAKSGSKVAAKVMMGVTEISKNINSRSLYGSWMVTQKRFAQVIANRMWKKVMGMGLVEPVDNFKDDTLASHPEVLEFITRLMVTVKFDLRKVQEILYATQTYQRSTLRTDVEQGDYAFEGRLLRRLTAEQVWDSLMTLAVSDIDTHKGTDAKELYALYERSKDMTPLQIFEQAKERYDAQGKALALHQEYMALVATMQGAKVGAERNAVIIKINAMCDNLEKLLNSSDPMEVNKRLGFGTVGSGARDSKMGQGNLLRASELPSPAFSDHLLYIFGQSDRELIDNSSSDAAVTQALALMNGLVEVDILSNRSVLYSNMQKASGAQGKIKMLWLTILSRQPTPQEMTMATRVFAANKNAANDLAWALINSREFLFVQ